VGIPGRVIQTKGTKIQNRHGIDLDHHLIPDPVGKAIACLIERIDELEASQKKSPKVTVEENCDNCEAESVCLPRKESPVKLAVRG
jgi:serine O-acetyltransferase